MTGAALVEVLTPTRTVKLGKDILVGKRRRFAAGDVVNVRLTCRDDFGSEIRVWAIGDESRYANCATRDLAGCEIADEVMV